MLVPLNKEERFLLWVAFVRKVFPELFEGQAQLVAFSLGDMLSHTPRSKEAQSYFPILQKIHAIHSANLGNVEPEKARVSLELTTQEIETIREVLLATESDPLCEDQTRIRLTALRGKLHTE